MLDLTKLFKVSGEGGSSLPQGTSKQKLVEHLAQSRTSTEISCLWKLHVLPGTFMVPQNI